MAAHHSRKIYRSAYHPITDRNDWPIANLVILFLSSGRPHRAELYLNVDAPTPNGSEHLAAFALAAARNIVERHYATDYKDATKLEVRLLHVEQRHPTEHFDLTLAETDNKQSIFEPWLLAAIAGILMILIGVIWGFSTLLNRPATVSETIADGGVSEVVELPVGQAGGGQFGSSEGTDAAGAASNRSVSSVAVSVIDPALPQTNGLAPSTNANNNLNTGQRVRVVPGAALTLRTQPGAAAGEGIGFMENAQEATIIGGPYWLQGLSDTIVWWYVKLDDGREAWAPANDSQFMLLEPAPRG